jgi:hypothetical protein
MVWFARALLLFAINAIAFLFGRSVAMRYRRQFDPWADEELGPNAEDALKGEPARAADANRSASNGKAHP